VIEIPFVGQAYTLDTIDISGQRCVNLYPEIYNDGNTKISTSLRSTAGLTQFGSIGDINSPYRGFHLASTGAFFGVDGASFRSISTAGVGTLRLTLTTGLSKADSAIVRMADSLDNSDEVNVLIVDGSATGNIWNITTSTATTIDATDNYPGGTHVAQIGGYFIVNKPNTLTALFSAINNPSSWNTLNTISKEATTDNINGLIAHNGRLWLFGDQSYQVHQATGNANNPFLSIGGTDRNIGLEAPDSLAENGKAVFWLGSNSSGFGQIYMSQGFDAMAITTIPLEREIQAYTSTTDAEGFCFQQDGHDFYQISFPTDNKTWVYDLTTGMWHERSYRNPASSVDERHRARVQGFFNGKNYFGDWDLGLVYESNPLDYTDNGDTIIRNRTSPIYWNALERVYYDSIQVDLQTGVGLTTGQGSDPLAMLESSNDSGHTYGNKMYIKTGKVGEFFTRVKINRQGMSRNRVYRLTYSEPTPFTVLGLFAEIS